MKIVFFIAICGALGAVARYGFCVGVEKIYGGPFPLGTLLVNVVGCFLLGLLLHCSWTFESISMPMRHGLTVGFLGAFTTFSVFSMDTVRLWTEGRWLSSLGNVGGNVVFGVLAIALGVQAGRYLGPANGQDASHKLRHSNTHIAGK